MGRRRCQATMRSRLNTDTCKQRTSFQHVIFTLKLSILNLLQSFCESRYSLVHHFDKESDIFVACPTTLLIVIDLRASVSFVFLELGLTIRYTGTVWPQPIATMMSYNATPSLFTTSSALVPVIFLTFDLVRFLLLPWLYSVGHLPNGERSGVSYRREPTLPLLQPTLCHLNYIVRYR